MLAGMRAFLAPVLAGIVLPSSLIAAESLLTLAWMRVLLRVAPSRALRGVLGEEAGGRAADPRVIAAFHRAAARAPFGHTCIHRALALQRVLARRGTAATLRIGIGRKPNLFPGHAWLEIDGAVVGDDAELVSRYVPLAISESALEVSFR
jgi:Transglutaminase-like superfamily